MVYVDFKKGQIAKEQTCLFYTLIDLNVVNSNTVKLRIEPKRIEIVEKDRPNKFRIFF
jgi:hypothetical protein